MTSQHIARRVTDVALTRMGEVPVVALQGRGPSASQPCSTRSPGSTTQRTSTLTSPTYELQSGPIDACFSDSPAPCLSTSTNAFQRSSTSLEPKRRRLPTRPVRAHRLDRFDALPRSTQTLTGRIHFISIWPFSQGELGATQENFLDVAATAPERIPTGLGHGHGATRADYARRICAGGMPIAVRSSTGRNRRFDDYATSSLQHPSLRWENGRRRVRA